jgi:hypothetical protein
LCFIGEPGRSIPGSTGIDGYPGQSGVPGAKGKDESIKDLTCLLFLSYR